MTRPKAPGHLSEAGQAFRSHEARPAPSSSARCGRAGEWNTVNYREEALSSSTSAPDPAEEQRLVAEESRVSAERERRLAEETRRATESLRDLDELNRSKGELSRVDA